MRTVNLRPGGVDSGRATRRMAQYEPTNTFEDDEIRNPYMEVAALQRAAALRCTAASGGAGIPRHFGRRGGSLCDARFGAFAAGRRAAPAAGGLHQGAGRLRRFVCRRERRPDGRGALQRLGQPLQHDAGRCRGLLRRQGPLRGGPPPARGGHRPGQRVEPQHRRQPDARLRLPRCAVPCLARQRGGLVRRGAPHAGGGGCGCPWGASCSRWIPLPQSPVR